MCHGLQAPAARFVLYCSSSGTQSQAMHRVWNQGWGREGRGWAATSQHHSWAGATGGALCSALRATALTGSLPISCGTPIP